MSFLGIKVTWKANLVEVVIINIDSPFTMVGKREL